jgi:hypothetical protein
LYSSIQWFLSEKQIFLYLYGMLFIIS